MPDKEAFFSPFSALKELIDRDSLPSLDRILPKPAQDEVEDEAFFRQAMVDVKPLSVKKKTFWRSLRPSSGVSKRSHQSGPIDFFHAGLRVEDLPEYIEELVYGEHPLILAYLRQGAFSPQRHLDLHGLTVAEAQEALDEFLHQSISVGCRCVLIIHGRGLSSPRGPVLKGKIRQWLTRGFWRRYVIALSSARPCDGGPGATYVLLRRRPASKKIRRRRRRR
ncbi:Smr/MutS family protein [Thermosulfuriphilus sp.]